MTETKMLTIELPADLAQELATASQALAVEIVERGLRDLRVEHALERYRSGQMTFAAAAEVAGVSQSELAVQAYARGMEPSFSETTLEEEVYIKKTTQGVLLLPKDRSVWDVWERDILQYDEPLMEARDQPREQQAREGLDEIFD